MVFLKILSFYFTAGKHATIELAGSPCTLIRQKAGVTYAVNCAGPAYQAVNDITYTSEHHQFASFDRNVNFGKYTYLTHLSRMGFPTLNS